MWNTSDNQLIFESYDDKVPETIYDMLMEIKELRKNEFDLSSHDLIYHYINKIQDSWYSICSLHPDSSTKIFIFKKGIPAGAIYDVICAATNIQLYKNNPDIVEVTYHNIGRSTEKFYIFSTEQSYKNNIFDIFFDFYPLFTNSENRQKILRRIVTQSADQGLTLKSSDMIKYGSTSGIKYDDGILSEVDDLFESKNNMKTFKQFFNESFEIGLEEQIKIPELGLVIPAKIDSGNDAYNVLHGENIQINGNLTSFTTIKGKQITKPLKDTITINVGAGNTEDRPVVCFDIILGNKKFKNVPFSIGNRADNEYPILVGKPFISKIGALINVRKKNTL